MAAKKAEWFVVVPSKLHGEVVNSRHATRELAEKMCRRTNHGARVVQAGRPVRS